MQVLPKHWADNIAGRCPRRSPTNRTGLSYNDFGLPSGSACSIGTTIAFATLRAEAGSLCALVSRGFSWRQESPRTKRTRPASFNPDERLRPYDHWETTAELDSSSRPGKCPVAGGASFRDSRGRERRRNGNSRGGSAKTRHRRQRLDAHQRRVGTDDDRPRPGLVLQRVGPQEERAGRDDAMRIPDVLDDGRLGPMGIHLELWRRYARPAAEMDRQRRAPVHARRASHLARRQGGHTRASAAARSIG